MGSKTIVDFSAGLPRPAVMCTIVKITGSAPQSVGARMWVTEKEFLGTLGGGELERRVLQDARALLTEPGGAAGMKEYVLCKQLGQCCGGRVDVFLEPAPKRRTVHLFGAGHVGRALAQVLSEMPYETTMVDARPDWTAREGVPADVAIVQAEPLEYARGREWGPDDAACVFTHSHDLDFSLIKELLGRPLGYLGLIGSEHKADVFLARLRSQEPGVDWAELWDEKLSCPIGVPLDSKNPKVIAVSIAAELLKEWGLVRA
jgi:xanthine dehydrogenase accessory factor